MKAIEVLRNHIKALENGEWISPAMIEQYQKAVEQVEAMQLLVMNMRSSVLAHGSSYHIFIERFWFYDARYDENACCFWLGEDTYDESDVTYVCPAEDTDNALNAATEEVTQ